MGVLVCELALLFSKPELEKSHGQIKIILSETKTPDGYRGTEDISLYFKQNTGNEDILLVSNQWETGAYAMPQVTTTLNNMITYYDKYNGSNTLNLNNDFQGYLFAVVLKKKNEVWCPISGTYESGYMVAENNSMDSVISAAKENWFPFQLTNSTDYQVNITELPGDISKYYHFNQGGAEYAVGYYYSTASNSNQISSDNTYTIYYPGLEGSEDNIQDRVFSTRIYVPNVKNRIIVQKQDDSSSDKYVAGAKFNLYSEDSVTEVKDASDAVIGYQLNGDAKAIDTLTTNVSMEDSHGVDLLGANSFPTVGKVLPIGTYFIQEQPLAADESYTIVSENGNEKETVPNDAYIVNPELIKIVVDKTGIYAYAGDSGENDGVTVQYGVGAIVRSMLRFAEEDDIDTTLHDITASLWTTTTRETEDC